ncbi:unnamed protein product, partial [Tenebrio molitor]
QYFGTYPYSAYPQNKTFNPSYTPNIKSKQITDTNSAQSEILGQKNRDLVRISPKEEIKVGELNSEKSLENKNQSLASYKAHPLFHYLKNKNTIQTDRIISFRNNNLAEREKITTLILKPVAKAVAGVDGQAVSTPLSRAVLRQGTNVDILFEPEAVA